MTYPDANRAAEACAQHIAESIEHRLAEAETATLAISGGSTPRLMFPELARRVPDWGRVHLFWVDERGVPPDHEQSNYRMADEFLIRRSNLPASNVHRIRAELPAQQAAAEYRRDIQDFFRLAEGQIPVFDLVQLGMGPEGHTGSLFPGEPLIADRHGIAAAVYVEKFKQWRITLLPAVLLSARERVFLITGADKVEALRQVMAGDYNPSKWPAQVIAREAGKVQWFIDDAAQPG
jgi:6-phosphogluconolactonase